MQLRLLVWLSLICLVVCAGGKQKKKSVKELKSEADMAMMKKDYKTAAKAYTKIIAKDPNQLNYHKRATIYAKQHQYESAIFDLGRAVEKDPKFYKGYFTRAGYRVLIGECEEAVADYKKVVEIKPKQAKKVDPKMPAALKCAQQVKAVREAETRKQWSQVHAQASEALLTAYESTSLMLLKCTADIEMRDYQSALVDTREVLVKDKTNLEALVLRGKAFYAMGDHDLAITHYREGLRLAPEHKLLKKNYKMLRSLKKATDNGEISFTQGKYEEAVEYFRQATTVDPSNEENNIKLLLRIVESHLQGKQGDEAAAAASGVIAKQPNNIDAWMKRGEARLLQEQWQDAINDYTKATQIDGNNRAAQEGLQKAKLELKKSERKDYYKILGVAKDADEKTIKKAFRKLALQWHPDKHKGEEEKKAAEEKFREIGEASEILSDPETRGRYDRGEDIKPEGGGGGRNPFHHFQQGGQQFHFNFG